jgi:hypothetical protein
LVILDQHPSQISLPALGNTYTTLCLNLKHSKDVSAMGQAMLLDSGERDILGNLEVGQAAVKLQGRATRPFLIEIPEFPLRKGTVTDEQVANRMKGKVSRILLDAEQFNVETIEATSELLSTPSPSTDIGVLFLGDILEYPESGVAQRYKRLGISVRQGQKWKARLAERRDILETLETTSTGTRRVIRLTEQGRRRLSESGFEPSKAPD